MQIYDDESIEIGDRGKGCRALLVVKSSFEVHHGCYLLSKSVVGRGLGYWVGDGIYNNDYFLFRRRPFCSLKAAQRRNRRRVEGIQESSESRARHINKYVEEMTSLSMELLLT